jgi:cytochrome c oxidase assembly protein subunit 11
MTRHGRTALALSCVVVTMIGASFAAVPLYEMFCRATGFAGTPMRVDQPSQVTAPQTVTVRFSGTVQSQLPWRFAPEVPTMTLQVGENGLMAFRATNVSSQPLVGTATFNVTPEKAAPYFAKTECFCFTEQRLAPGESVDMPVAFFVDPAILENPGTRDIRNITLSYTFFRAADDPGKRATALAVPPASTAAN